MECLSLDIESRSIIDLPKAGAHRYWEHPLTKVLCAAWAIDYGPINTWLPGEPVPEAVDAHIRSGGVVAAWNATFELQGLRRALGPVHGWPVPDISQIDDTAARAAAMALPRALEDAAEALNLPVKKDLAGKKAMMALAKPRKPRKGEDPDGIYWNEDPALFAKLLPYNRTDVEVERAIRRHLLPLSDKERALFALDSKINDRGVRFDWPLIAAMEKIAAAEAQRLNDELAELTGGAITSTDQVPTLGAWLLANGMPSKSLAKDVVAESLARSGLPDQVRRVLEIRQEGGKTSTKKLKAARKGVNVDGRSRGLLLYHGAATGRWSGSKFQPHNLPRPSKLVKSIDTGVDWLMSGDADLVRFGWGNPLQVMADCMRGVIIAEDDCVLFAADFSQIESRTLSWLSGDTAKLDAYREIDAGRGIDMYIRIASGIFGVEPSEINEDDPRRQVGKVSELSMGYAGGVTALSNMAKNYFMHLAPALPALLASSDAEIIARAERRYEDCLRRSDASADVLSREEWMACELTKQAWRASNPAAVAYWARLAVAAERAVACPGEQVDCGVVSFKVAHNFLWVRLPSGRCLAYCAPRIRMTEPPWSDKSKPENQREKVKTVKAYAADGKKWLEFSFYGGLFAQNITQAVARDLLADSMLRVEAAGYPIVLSVHDELVAEVPENFGSLEEFLALAAKTEAWAGDLPVVAKGFRNRRYRKG